MLILFMLYVVQSNSHTLVYANAFVVDLKLDAKHQTAYTDVLAVYGLHELFVHLYVCMLSSRFCTRPTV
jgi:hypothetical protein